MSEVITPPNQYVLEVDVPIIENDDNNEKFPEDKYKKIVVKIDNPLTIFEKELLFKIQKKFSKNGFNLQISELEIVLYLQLLDFEAFKNYVYGLIKRFPDEPPDDFEIVHSSVFSEIVGKIEEIKSYGVRGGKRLYVIYNREKKVEGRQAKVQKRGQYYYAKDNTFSKMNNKLPEKFENVIINRDSALALNQLPDNCIDFIITSPPYNFGLGYDTSKDGINWDKYFVKLFAIFDECIRVLKYGGRIIVNIQPLFSDYIPSHHIISTHFMEKKMIWKGEVLWEKNNYNCKYCAWGSWKSPSSPYLKYTWEFLEIFAKGDLKKEGLPENIDIKDDEFKKWVVAKWSIAPEKKMAQYGHPAMFPEELVMRAIKLFSYEGDVVLDPFNGVGTTCVVAKRFNRKYVGIDISKKYCEIAKKRLNEVLPGTN